MILLSTDLPQRIQDKIRERDGCWEWMGYRSTDGYGRVRVAGRLLRVHRYVYERLIGPITKETLDHLCRNRWCCNPEHLVPATNHENILAPGSQTPSKHNADKACCPRCGRAYSREKHRAERICRPCRAAWHQEWWAANRDRINAAKRAKRAAKQGTV